MARTGRPRNPERRRAHTIYLRTEVSRRLKERAAEEENQLSEIVERALRRELDLPDARATLGDVPDSGVRRSRIGSL